MLGEVARSWGEVEMMIEGLLGEWHRGEVIRYKTPYLDAGLLLAIFFGWGDFPPHFFFLCMKFGLVSRSQNYTDIVVIYFIEKCCFKGI